MNAERVRVVLVAGISCSGKTTFAERLTEQLDALHLRLDDYYRGFDALSLDERRKINFDAPEAVEHELLHEHLTALKAGLPIHRPVYDHAGFARRGTTLESPRPFVVLEGLFALYWPEVWGLGDLRVFVETPVEVCLERRLFRDAIQFGRSREETFRRYSEHVAPNQDRYVLPTRHRADVLLDGEGCLDTMVTRVAHALRHGEIGHERAHETNSESASSARAHGS